MAKIRSARTKAVAAAGQDPTEDIHDTAHAISLVGTHFPSAADRQQERGRPSFVAGNWGLDFFHNGHPIAVRDPAAHQVIAQPPGQAEFVARHGTGRGIKHKRRFLTSRGG